MLAVSVTWIRSTTVSTDGCAPLQPVCSSGYTNRLSCFEGFQLRLVPEEASRLPPPGGSHRGTKDEMAMRREESDGRGVPDGRRKAVSTARRERGGKATTASKRAGQRNLFFETADSPQGAVPGAETGLPAPSVRYAVPKSRNTPGVTLPAMTMEEVASDENLIRAFAEVARNRGAPGPDGRSIDEVREHLDELLPVLRCRLLDGTYRPGMIRRVWIPKPGGGERGLGIPDVVDRWVQQAVHRVLSPHWEPTFHPSSHGFRPGRSCRTAIAEAKTSLAEGYERVIDLDLEKFFDRPPPTVGGAAGDEGQGPATHRAHPTDAHSQGGDARGSGGEYGRGRSPRGSAVSAAQ